MAEDWDLWAVVRSSSTPFATVSANPTTASAASIIIAPQPVPVNSFGRTYNGFQELERIIKPFITPESQRICKSPRKQLPSPPPPPAPVIKRKYESVRGKSRRKRVLEVDAEKLLEIDPWNWHKYGRKPIKASPYPRNYYKCSSEGNKCKAKKYIEKSWEHPDMFIVSYSNDHNHPPPIRRSKLSCTTRKNKPYKTAKDCLLPPPCDAALIPPSLGGDPPCTTAKDCLPPPSDASAMPPPSLGGDLPCTTTRDCLHPSLGGDLPCTTAKECLPSLPTPSDAASMPPSLCGEQEGIWDVGGDIFFGLEELGGGHRPSSGEMTSQLDEIFWDSNNELVYW